MKIQDLKKTFLFAAVRQTGYQNRKKLNLLESIGALVSKISSLEPKIFKVKEWFQIKHKL